MSNTGVIEWQKCLGGTNTDGASSINQTLDGGYIVSNSTGSNDGDITVLNGVFDYWIIKLNSVGAIIWQKSLGGTDEDGVASIKQAPDGGFIIAGNTYSNDGDVTGNHGGNDYWIVKLSAEAGLSEFYSTQDLVSIYPNPTEGVIHIKDIPLESKIQIQDVNGRVIYSQISTAEAVDIDLSNLVSKGVYFVHILNVSDEVTDIQKVVLQ